MLEDHKSPASAFSSSVGVGSSVASTGGEVSSTGAGVVKSSPDNIDVISCCLAGILGMAAGIVDMAEGGIEDTGNPSESVKAGNAGLVVGAGLCHISKTTGASATDLDAWRGGEGGELGDAATVLARWRDSGAVDVRHSR